MIEFLSNWAKSLGLAIIIISLLEMILPNNKTKKYVRMVFGIYMILNIVSPFIKNKDILDVNTYDFNEYSNYTINESSLNESSMDNRIEEIYIEELEKDITQKVNALGYQVMTCNVYATLSSQNEENYIEKIELTVEKSETQEQEKETIENKLVNEIQKIKPVNTSIGEISKNDNNQDNSKQNISNNDIQKIKKFLKEEYGVEETCLKIN
mgnify:FL=1